MFRDARFQNQEGRELRSGARNHAHDRATVPNDLELRCVQHITDRVFNGLGVLHGELLEGAVNLKFKVCADALQRWKLVQHIPAFASLSSRLDPICRRLSPICRRLQPLCRHLSLASIRPPPKRRTTSNASIHAMQCFEAFKLRAITCTRLALPAQQNKNKFAPVSESASAAQLGHLLGHVTE